MPRVGTGSVIPKTLTDGTCAFELRFHARGRRESVTLHERAPCECGCGGGWDERSARRELGNILARVRAGVWTRDAPHPRVAAQAAAATRPDPDLPRVRVLLAAGEDRRRARRQADRRRTPTADYRWRLRGHLLPFFARPPARRDRPRALPRLQGAQAPRGGRAARGDRRRRRPARPARAANRPARAVVDPQAHRHARRDPRRRHRGRAHRPQPGARQAHARPRAQAAADVPRDGRAGGAASTRPAAQDAPLDAGQDRCAQAARPRAQGRASCSPRACAKARSPPSSASRRPPSATTLRRLGVEDAARLRRPARSSCGSLGYSGVRISELCDLRIRDVRLHDPDGARFHIPDAKTETGIRDVQMSPDLAEAFVDAPRPPAPRRPAAPDPDDYVVPEHARRPDQPPARRRDRRARPRRARPSERAQRAVCRRCPTTTPHSLRRTYISIALLANRFDVKWVMSQVGHADSKMTLDVYAQLEQRVKREHGRALRRPRARRARAAPRRSDRAPNGRRKGDGAPRGRAIGPLATSRPARRNRSLCRASRNGETRTRTGDTTIFSRVLYQLSYLALMG